METLAKVVGAVGLGLALLFVIGALCAFPLMWLTNYLFTPTLLLAVFGIAKLTFWKAFWLLFFAGFIFKSTTTNKTAK